LYYQRANNDYSELYEALSDAENANIFG